MHGTFYLSGSSKQAILINNSNTCVYSLNDNSDACLYLSKEIDNLTDNDNNDVVEEAVDDDNTIPVMVVQIAEIDIVKQAIDNNDNNKIDRNW